MIDFIKNEGRLAITQAEIDVMQVMLDGHDRAGFYILYNALSDNDQSSVQGRIATFSGIAGGSAFVANRLDQEFFHPDDGYLAGFNGWNYTGMYQLSQEIAQSALDFIRQDILVEDGTGDIRDDEFFDSSQQAWTNAGLLPLFPGNALTALELAAASMNGIYAFLIGTIGDELPQDYQPTPESKDRFLEALSEIVRDLPSPGTFFSVLATLIFEEFEKTSRDLDQQFQEIQGPNGITIYVNGEGQVQGMDDLGLADGAGAALRGLFIAGAAATPFGLALYNLLQDFLIDLVSRPLDGVFNPVTDFVETAGLGRNGDTQTFDPAQPDPDAPRWSDDATSGADILQGSDGFFGFGGKDTIEAGEGNDIVFGGKGADILGGNAGDDILWGQQGEDELDGGEGDDILRGGAGDDTFIGGAGDDLLDGGDIQVAADEDGEDSADYSENDDRIIFDLSGLTQEEIDDGFLIVTNDGTGGTDTLHSIEIIIGTDFDDVFIIPYELSTLGITSIDFGMGDDLLDFSGDIDGVNFDPAEGEIEFISIEQVILTEFADTLTFDMLLEDGQTALVDARAEDDAITVTIDTVDEGTGIVVINGGDGADTIEVTDNSTTSFMIVFGGAEDDMISVDSGFADIYGG